MPEMRGPEPWWRSYFDDEFYRLHRDLFPEAESRIEVAAMRELLGLATDARVLDVPCGWGRHTLLLQEAAHDAFGADISLLLLERAAAATRNAGYPLRYAASDMRALPFRDASFDAVLNVFTSLGLFLSDEEDLRVLREAARVLRPGGALLLESMHRDEVMSDYAERDAWTLPDGTRVLVRRRFDPVTGVSHERLRWKSGDETGEKRHQLRLRTATELDRLLGQAGFAPPDYFGDWDGTPLERLSPRVIAVARKS
jgi:ubiquinone/menaquinone biosynthesis C-methylase UbiE